MDRQNLVPILITILIATLLTYLILSFNDSNKKTKITEVEQPMFPGNISILVAADNLTLGKKLQHTDLRWQEWPKETLTELYTVKNTRKLDHFLGMIVRKQLQKENLLFPNILFNQQIGMFLLLS